MRLSDATLQDFESFEQEYIADWLIRGFERQFFEELDLPFSPHNFVALNQDHVDSIRFLFEQSSISVKRKIFFATRSLLLSAYGVLSDVRSDERLRLNYYESVLALCVSVGCINAVPTIVENTKELKSFFCENNAGKLFSKSIFSIGDIIFSSRSNHFQESADFYRQLESEIGSLLQHPLYAPIYSPYLMSSLICVAPQNLGIYLDLFVPSINDLYQYNQLERTTALLVAHTVVDYSMMELQKIFHRLNFEDKSCMHYWLVEALICDGHLLRVVRSKDPSKPHIFYKSMTYALVHKDWVILNIQGITDYPLTGMYHEKLESLVGKVRSTLHSQEIN